MILKRKIAAVLAVVASFCFCFVFGCNKEPEIVVRFDYGYEMTAAERISAIWEIRINVDELIEKRGDIFPVPTRELYKFLGWEPSSIDGEPVENFKELSNEEAREKLLSSKEIVFTAAWELNAFTVTLENSTKADFTAWADGTTGAKTVMVETGKKISIPEIEHDSMSEQARDNDDYWFDGWFYKDKTGKETKLDISKPFTFEDLNVESLQITVYAKVHKQWAGPY